MKKYLKYILVVMFIFVIGNNRVNAADEDESKTLSDLFKNNPALAKDVQKNLKGYEGRSYITMKNGTTKDIPSSLLDGYKVETGSNMYVFQYTDQYNQKRYSVIYEGKKGSNTKYFVKALSVENDESKIKEGGELYLYRLQGEKDTDALKINEEEDPTKVKNPNYNNQEGVGVTGGKTRPVGGSEPVTPLPSIEPSETSCSDLFAGVGDQIKEIFKAIKIAVPILVIVLSSLDFAKAIFGGDDGETKKAQSKFIKRLVVALIFFLLPTFMNFMMGVINGVYNGSWDCMILE